MGSDRHVPPTGIWTLLTQLAVDWNASNSNPGHEGYDKVLELQKTLLHAQFPKTALGLFMSVWQVRPGSDNPQVLAPQEVVVDVNAYNKFMPSNIKLLCGDIRLKCIESHVREAERFTGDGLKVFMS